MTVVSLLVLWVIAFMCHAALWPARYGLPVLPSAAQSMMGVTRFILPVLALGLAVEGQGSVMGVLLWFAALSFGGLMAASLLVLRGTIMREIRGEN
ncbi:hypothetical protein [Komagataeibacter europaeus]|uniref:hypothetical protein n=1 Tax=Komagataeibacter europaeus TaxID=33995 RepID=UPI00036D4D47|nr:hypothetical protein [Komagataeibacter europaeus]